MEKYEEKMHSCNCFFDLCLISQSKNEDLTQLSKRISIYMRKKYEALLENGFCFFSHCKPANFRNKAIWILKETNHEFKYVNKYIVCRNHISDTLKKKFIGEYEEFKMNSRCDRKNSFLKSLGNHSCCFSYYRSGLVDAAFFLC